METSVPEEISEQSRSNQVKLRFAELVVQPVSVCLLLAIVTIALYWPATGFEFISYDDPHYVVENVHVHPGLTWGGMVWAFSTGHEGFWQPLTWLSLMLDVTLLGRGAGGFHFTNVLLHAANSILVFLLFRRLSGAHWQSAMLAALFALHPLRVESVAWVTERKDVLSTFFGLLALLMYERYYQKSEVQSPSASVALRRDRKSKTPYHLALLFFALGLMSKPMLVTLPFAMLLLDCWPLQRFTLSTLKSGSVIYFLRSAIWPLIREKIPFFALAAIFSVITFFVQRHAGYVKSLAVLTVTDRMENAVMSYFQYMGKTFWPVNLAFFYPRQSHWPLDVTVLAVSLLIVLCIAAVWIGQRHPFVFTGWFWFAGTLVPVIGLVQSGHHVIADRYTYVPLIGIFVIISWGAARLFTHWKCQKTIIALTTGVVLIACAFRTRDQLDSWRNDGTLFRHAIAVTQNNHLAYYNLGFYLANKGLPNEAISNYREAIRIYPNDMNAHLNLGVALESVGSLDEAETEYCEALRINPNSIETHFNFGCVLISLGRRDEAIEQFRQALRLKPGLRVAELRLQQLGVSPSP